MHAPEQAAGVCWAGDLTANAHWGNPDCAEGKDYSGWTEHWMVARDPSAQSDIPVIQGTAVNYEVPMIAVRLGKNTARDTALEMEKIQQQQSDKERVKQLERMLACSLGHQQRMPELTQANRELEEKSKTMTGKSTQTASK